VRYREATDEDIDCILQQQAELNIKGDDVDDISVALPDENELIRIDISPDIQLCTECYAKITLLVDLIADIVSKCEQNCIKGDVE